MRLHLSLQITNGKALPLDYSRFVQAWIYKTISQSDKDFATWLHNEGIQLTHKKFKFFTFSQLQAKTKAHLGRKLLEIKQPDVQITLSFLLPEAMKNFIKGLFESQTGFWGDQFNGIEFIVSSVDILPEPIFSEYMSCDCRQPVVTRYRNAEKKIKFAEPQTDEFKRQLDINARSKYEAYYGKAYAETLDILIKKVYKRKERRNGNNKVIAVGWTCELEVTASKQMQSVIYYGGFGVSNSFGCGFGTKLNTINE